MGWSGQKFWDQGCSTRGLLQGSGTDHALAETALHGLKCDKRKGLYTERSFDDCDLIGQ